MHAFPADSTNTNQDLAPVLIVGSSDAARQRAMRSVAAAGFRIAAAVDLASAPDRMEIQGRASALWLELDDSDDAAADAALDQLTLDVGEGRYGAVIAAPASLIDPLAARFPDTGVELVIDGNDAERAAALAIVTSGAYRPDRLHDIASDQNNARLRQLSDEVSRIAATLARLSTGPGQPQRIQEAPPPKDVPDVSVDTVRTVIRARRLRGRFFDEELFADPAWDMLLDLFQAELAQLRVPVSSLCIAAAVPATTALRWLKTMTGQGLFVRRADPHDGRRVFVELAPQASVALRRYFAEVGNPATI
ncbi:MAG TPA: MarR family winged helix-turn-helix transcriptional regulator [Sphingomicrobium sp.]